VRKFQLIKFKCEGKMQKHFEGLHGAFKGNIPAYLVKYYCRMPHADIQHVLASLLYVSSTRPTRRGRTRGLANYLLIASRMAFVWTYATSDWQHQTMTSCQGQTSRPIRARGGSIVRGVSVDTGVVKAFGACALIVQHLVPITSSVSISISIGKVPQ
jgi:hypothetical protein